VSRVGYVVIGRNEGERLVACLASLEALKGAVVYVDSGSRDESIMNARKSGADIVALDMSTPFTAARARNAGAKRLVSIEPHTDYIQFIDGDCVLNPAWPGVAVEFLDRSPLAAVACGRLRERFPDASLYNRLCDLEWDTPIGETDACGGIAMFRRKSFESVGGFNEALVAGEEPELCLRLREKGAIIMRLDADMALHDAAMTRFSQWRRRATRAGYAFSEISSLHRKSPKRIWARETLRAVLWAGLLPATLLGALVSPAALLALLLYPAQYVRILLRNRARLGRDAPAFAALSVIGKFAEGLGVIKHRWAQLRGRSGSLIEYK
jgi:GT2 family glycosyltransferase